METEAEDQAKHNQSSNNNMNRTSSSKSDSPSPLESPHSPPLRFHSPLRSAPSDLLETPPFSSPVGSPEKSPPPIIKSPEKSPSPSPISSPKKLSPRDRSPEMAPTPAMISPENPPPFLMRPPDDSSPSLVRSPEKSPPLLTPLKKHPPPEKDQQPPMDESKAIVLVVNKSTQFTPSPSPSPPHSVPYSPAVAVGGGKSPPENTEAADESKSPPPVIMFNRSVKEEALPPRTFSKKVGAAASSGRSGSGGALKAILRRTRREELAKVAALGFRLSEVVLSLISLSVMAADKTRGWSGDSFDRYKEYRFCLSVTAIAFVYSGFQAIDLAYYLAKEKHLIHHHLRPPFDFFMDQVLAYLLISASSAAATRVDDWVSNWGKDQFTEMASASVAMAFLTFVAFAFSSLISGYILCTRETI